MAIRVTLDRVLLDRRMSLTELGSNESVTELLREAQDAARRMLNDTRRVNGHTLFCYMMLDLWLERQGSAAA